MVIDDIDDVGNLEDLLKIVIMKNVGILKYLPTVGELTRNINKKKRSGVWEAYICPLCDKFLGESISSISMWNIVNQ